MHPVTFDNPNKMHIETGCKTFDQQTVLVTTGNVIAPTQHSGFIRAWNETQCNGMTFAPGHLQQFDLENWERLPRYVRGFIQAVAVDKSVILYEFGHFSKGKRLIDGYVVTDRDHRLLHKFYERSGKSYGIVDTCAEYVTQ